MKQIRTFLLLAALIFTANALGQDTKSATTPSASTGPQSHQPSAVRVVDLKASDGTILKASYFAAAKPGPGVLLLHQSNRTRDSWDGLARQLAAAGINTLTLDMRGFGESGTPYTKLTDAEKAKVSPCGPATLTQRFNTWFRSQASSATLSAWEETGGSASSIPLK